MMRSTKTLFILTAICVGVLLGFGTLAQGGQDRVFERDGTRVYGRLNSVDAAHVVFNGKIIERSQVIMILFAGAEVPAASPSSQQSGASTTDLVTMKNGDRSYGKVSRVTANTVVQSAAQLPRTNVIVIEFDVSPPGLIDTVEPNEPKPTPPAAPAASPSPPVGYEPAGEKPSPLPPSGAEKPLATDPKNPTPKSNCTNLDDFPDAGPACRTSATLHLRGAFLHPNNRCAAEWEVCGTVAVELGPTPKDQTEYVWGVCDRWVSAERKKGEGKAVCCDCKKAKPNPHPECSGCQCCKDCLDLAEQAFPGWRSSSFDSRKWSQVYEQCLLNEKCKEKCK